MSTKSRLISTKYFEYLNKYPRITIEEERILCDEIKKGNELALNQLINSNLKLVIKIITNEFSNYCNFIPREELITEGNYGLFLAAKKYDYSLGAKFSTYAAYWIKCKIYEHRLKCRNDVRIPSSSFAKIKKIKIAIEKLNREGFDTPTKDQIKEETHLSDLTIGRFLNSLINQVSFDKPLEYEENSRTNMYNLYEIEQEEKYITDVEKEDIKKYIQEALNKILTEKEKDIIIRRFGLFDTQPETLNKICKKWNLTRERIRQIEVSSLKKLRLYLKR